MTTITKNPASVSDGGLSVMKLNLGASDRDVEGYISVDIAPPADQIVDLAGPWPWETSSVDEVLAMDVIEHIRNGYALGANLDVTIYPYTKETPYRANGRVHFMNELHRVLKPGARATIETPNASRGCGFYQDPTHVSPWCLSTFKYFERGAFAHTRLSKAYGITAAFRIISLSERETPGECAPETAWKITCIVEAVK